MATRQNSPEKSSLSWKPENQWKYQTAAEKKKIFAFADDYIKALNAGKTERQFYQLAVSELEKKGFRDLAGLKEVKAGDKVYLGIHEKGLMSAVVGTASPMDGFLMVGSHIDSPRLDLKPNPLMESNEIAYFKTHYYGGIKKYQWVAIPLALHGVVMLADGSKLSVDLGEEENEPCFYITDLLPHLGKDQMAKKASQVIEGEQLNIVLGNIPANTEKDAKDPTKQAILEILHEKYGITERDLYTAELEIVPANKARYVGLDRSFVAGYAQDDHVCAYTSLRALLDAAPSAKTQVMFLFDKEEIGSTGSTGAQSELYYYALHELAARMLGRDPSVLEVDHLLQHSKLLSSDVTNAFDPSFADVSDPLNTAYVAYGIGINKYTGAGGKGNTNDANAEYFNEVTRLFDAQQVPWQAGELGKVDQGGGGTIAKFFAQKGINVIDCGVAVLSMHSCYELTSTLDVYNTYRAYKAFYENAR